MSELEVLVVGGEIIVNLAGTRSTITFERATPPAGVAEKPSGYVSRSGSAIFAINFVAALALPPKAKV